MIHNEDEYNEAVDRLSDYFATDQDIPDGLVEEITEYEKKKYPHLFNKTDLHR